MKLRRRWIGPFSIAKVISLVAYWLNLPPNWWIHLAFHVSNLKRYYRSEEFEVEAILRYKGSGVQRLYQVLWKGYPITEAIWELES